MVLKPLTVLRMNLDLISKTWWLSYNYIVFDLYSWGVKYGMYMTSHFFTLFNICHPINGTFFAVYILMLFF